ncbi:MAG TPA: RodZ domain-containing protein [Rhodanobacteraceae bacterium]|jgi:cytoskeleton protein RodZ|nr:RodZ domain-containing protein [Rhodanobacteraceae bacterium]
MAVMNSGQGQQSDENAAKGASAISNEPESVASIDQDNGQLALPLLSGRHIMRAEELDTDGKASSETLPQPGGEILEVVPERTVQNSFGRRLRAAREGMNLSRNEVGQRLRLPLRLIAQLEDDDYAGIDQGVYLRGYLSSYARLVGIPTVAADTVATANVRTAPLVATGQMSRSRYLIDRYSVSATYLILTALIVVPAVWLATHGGLEQNLVRTTSLDGPSTIQVPLIGQPQATGADSPDTAQQPAAEANDSSPTDANTIAAVSEPPKQEQMPVVASMAPFTTQSPTPAAPAPESMVAHAAGAHSLMVKLTAASWVEIIGTDGSKLEYGILPGGAERTYTSDLPLSVRLGNAEGAEISVDGKVVDLAPFRHANVARLRVFGANGTEAPATEF